MIDWLGVGAGWRIVVHAEGDRVREPLDPVHRREHPVDRGDRELRNYVEITGKIVCHHPQLHDHASSRDHVREHDMSATNAPAIQSVTGSQRRRDPV